MTILTGVNISVNILIGDAGGSMFDHSKGGDDTLIGGDFTGFPYIGVNILIGDAGGSMFDHSKGGDDTLIGGVLGNAMYGDAVANMSGHAQGGQRHLQLPRR